MTSENNQQSRRDALLEKMLVAAFERVATGEPGRTPEQVLELFRERAERQQAMDITPEREAELKGTVKALGLAPEDNPDPAIRHVNAKMAQWELDGTLSEELRGVRYSNADPEDSASGADNAEPGKPEDESGNTPPPAPQGP